jgi:hypothetical protein
MASLPSLMSDAPTVDLPVERYLMAVLVAARLVVAALTVKSPFHYQQRTATHH